MEEFTVQPLHSSDHHAVWERFRVVNRKRRQRIFDCLDHDQQTFFTQLPLLLHLNDPALPGYVDNFTPAGIATYHPGKNTLIAVARRLPGFKTRPRARISHDIHALFCMGSSGTIAYTRNSDLDIWLVHAASLNSVQRRNLCKKLNALEEWAAELRLEVHFFPVTAAQVKSGSFERLSTESSGTTQHFLLLDEFYRSSVLLAGKPPAWWFVPAELESRYDDYLQSLVSTNTCRPDDFIDLGAVPGIPADEFFGAAVWQLFKSISSPYKSILKLLLMEVYADEHPGTCLLSQQYKLAIHGGESEIDRLDPYIMLYERIEAYLQKSQDWRRLDLLRRSLYLTIGVALSCSTNSSVNWRRDLLASMVQSWRWDRGRVDHIDQQPNWGIHDVLDERNVLMQALKTSYLKLSQFGKRHADELLISKADLNTLGRKLYAAFERRTGKIDVFNRGIVDDLLKPELTFVKPKNHEGRNSWMLFTSFSDIPDTSAPAPAACMASLVELICWCFFNRIMHAATALRVKNPYRRDMTREIRNVLSSICRHFPDGKLAVSDLADLGKPAAIKTAILYLNVDNDNCNLSTAADNTYLASRHSDALNYGGLHRVLIETTDLVITTSWEEILHSRHCGPDSLLTCICDYLNWTPPGGEIEPGPIHIYCFRRGYGRSCASRAEELMHTITRQFYSAHQTRRCRYIILVGDCYYSIDFDGQSFQPTQIGDYNALLHSLAAPQCGFRRICFDKWSMNRSPLPLIYEKNADQKIQLFLLPDGSKVKIYIVDEYGSLFLQTAPFHDVKTLINQYGAFLAATLQRRINSTHGQLHETETPDTECYLLSKIGSDRYLVQELSIERYRPASQRFFDIQVLGFLGEGNEKTLTIYCDNREFSSIEYGSDIFTVVAKHVLSLRRHAEKYPIYITDIDLSGILPSESHLNALQTVQFLKYKSQIERRLNEALAQAS